MFIFAVGFTGMCAICALCFVLWLLWSLFWIAYDHLMQRRRHLRVKNSELNAYRVTPKFNVGSDAK